MCKYYIVTLAALVRSSLDALFLLLAVILSKHHEKPRKNDWVENHITFFDWMSYFLCQFMLIFLSTPPSQVTYLYSTATGGNLCIALLRVVICVVISWVNGWKYENLLKFNTSWLLFLRAWYFSFSCSGYTLIKKSYTLNCYSFLQKFLLETKTYKLVVGHCDSSIYCEKNISEKVIYFLSLLPCSVKKLIPHMLFTCQNSIFSDFTWKKKFAPGSSRGLTSFPPPSPFLYSAVKNMWNSFIFFNLVTFTEEILNGKPRF